MKYFVIAGEASGDLHASNLVRQLKNLDPDAVFHGWGGDKMREAGVTIHQHYRETAFMGFLEVLKNLRTIMRLLKECRKQIINFNPDAIILVDYPGFNLRIADWARVKGYKVFYYISPQVWAWKKSRTYALKKSVDMLYTILPFEREFFQDYDWEVEYMGHPLLDVIKKYDDGENPSADDTPLIILMPGSRNQEVERLLPIMLKATDHLRNYRYAIAGVSGIGSQFYQDIINRHTPTAQVKLYIDNTYELLGSARAAVVTSGTATLETALFGVPQIVCYKTSRTSYFIARNLVHVKHISLVNIILAKPLLTELVQRDMSAEKLCMELKNIVIDGPEREKILNGYKELRNLLKPEGASRNIAKDIYRRTAHQELNS